MNGIGTYKERTLHSVLKHYIEPDETKHEQKYKGFVADIINENGITEVQTRAFNNLRKKLEVYLEDMSVTVVYPAVRAKWLVWVDPDTGETTRKRKSPKIGTPYEIYPELYKIKYLLGHPNLKICIVTVDVEEYRNLTGWSTDKKRGSTRIERIPIEIGEEIIIENPSDYIKLIPQNMPFPFTSGDFKKHSRISISAARTALNILNDVGAVERFDRTGSGYLYRLPESGS